MKRVLLVAKTTGYQTQMFAEAGRNLGLDIVLATDRCHVLENPWGDEAIALRFEDPEPGLSSVASAGPFSGVVALGDRPAWVGAVIASHLGIPFHSPESAALCANKHQVRQRFRDAGLPVPDFFLAPFALGPETAANRAPYPCVLKPLGLSASRGVIRANDPQEFATAFWRIQSLLRAEHDDSVLVEQFIPGREFALEGIVWHGRFRALALFDKPDPLDGPFFEETLYITPSRQPTQVQEAIIRKTGSAIKALGLSHGPVHAEMRVNEAGVWMLEVAARPIGGLCARVLPGLPELILRHATGDPNYADHFREGPAGVMMIPIPRRGMLQGVSGVEEARKVEGIEDVVITAKTGQELVPLPEGNSYLGFIFTRGDEAAAVENALRTAHAQLEFEITASLPVL